MRAIVLADESGGHAETVHVLDRIDTDWAAGEKLVQLKIDQPACPETDAGPDRQTLDTGRD